MALALGRTVSELEETLSAHELEEWKIIYRLEPWGEHRADIRSAHEMQLLANLNRNPKKTPTPFRLMDFLLKFGEMEGNMVPAIKTEQAQRSLDQKIRGAFQAIADGFKKKKGG